MKVCTAEKEERNQNTPLWRTVFPFAAVVGQEKIKNALLWNLVNPRIGGVLISGEKGTAKSTLVRGAAALAGDRKIVELPLNVTEDRLVGSVDLKAALQYGRKELEPGILKDADGNILYVDEVNLLSDHIINALLEVAASGVNVVEREGVSCSHPSRFILVGSMNPEEGKLRPQLLDRFGLYVEARGEKNIESRMEILNRRLDFEKDPLRFLSRYGEDTRILCKKVAAAGEYLPKVKVTENAMQLAATLAADAFCAGHRGELVLLETARTIAAMDGRHGINTEDIRTAAEYALPHRMRDAMQPSERRKQEPPPEDPNPRDRSEHTDSESESEENPSPDEHDSQAGSESPDESGSSEEEDGSPEEGADAPKQAPPAGNGQGPDSSPEGGDNPRDDGGKGSAQEDVQRSGELFRIPQWQDPVFRHVVNRGNGRRNRVRSSNRQGRYVSYRVAGDERITDLAFDATVRAAAPFQTCRDKTGLAIAIRSGDLRVKLREKRTGGCILFVVDASASMGVNKRMKEVKAAILSMLNVSYQMRDRVGLIAFRKDRAELLLDITRSVELAQKQLELLPTGGRTPLAKGLELAYEVVMGLKKKDPEALPTIVLVSDGRANQANSSGKGNAFADALKAAERIGNQHINTIILDTENDFIRLHLCEKLNEKLNGILVTMEELRSEGIIQAVNALKS